MELPSTIQIVVVIGALLAMLIGIFLVFRHIHKNEKQGLGPDAIHALGVVVFVPMLLILAIVTTFSAETLAAFLGVVAGYVLRNPTRQAAL